MSSPVQVTRIKRAELLSTLGAGVLGAGLALLFAEALAPHAIAIALTGVLAHAGGMAYKHLLENRRGKPAQRSSNYFTGPAG